uniref:DEAD-box ATP-dependent RNA helicase 10-like n=1 Tax=Nicotiana tabacum TaxID=4097 RepID=A0A1S4B9H6_TOBAC|nr:PREDICTED: DEAD-box ATP-dependent RNA helicase 10-like [Nicotiana tabacum]
MSLKLESKYRWMSIHKWLVRRTNAPNRKRAFRAKLDPLFHKSTCRSNEGRDQKVGLVQKYTGQEHTHGEAAPPVPCRRTTMKRKLSPSEDYIHRVGRTARAGRSGVAISLVNQYEVEWYKQIEKLIGKKLPEYPAEEEEVLLLLEHVTEAKRISQMKIKESGGKRKHRGGDDGDEEIDRYLGVKKGKLSGKLSKKPKRK